jgi:hypothetical protein
MMAVLVVVSALNGCTPSPSGDDLPTPLATDYIPTVIALTVAAGQTAAPPPLTDTPIPSRTPTITTTPAPTGPTTSPIPITVEPTPSETPTPDIPLADIQIYTPGPLSKIISPLRVRAFLAPGARGRILVELLGEDGRLLVRQLRSFNTLPGRKIILFEELDFEIAAVAEAGRLVLSTRDRFDRITHLASVDVILLSAGEEDINPAGDLLAPITVEDPKPDTLIQGGELQVSGRARPNSSQALVIELIDSEGRVLGSRQVDPLNGPSGTHQPFNTTLPYNVSSPTRALLVVRERGDRILGTTQLTSLEVLLSP